MMKAIQVMIVRSESTPCSTKILAKISKFREISPIPSSNSPSRIRLNRVNIMLSNTL